MIVDFHTHVFPEKIAERTLQALSQASNDKPYTNGMIDGLLAAMETATADLSVCLPVMTKPTQFDSLNRFAIEINERFNGQKKGIISFGGMHPDCEGVEDKLLFLKENGIKGIKIHPDYQQTFIDDPKYIKILQVAKELDLIVVTHSGIDDGYKGQPVRCTPERVKNVIEKVGHKKFVLGHYGAHKLWQETLEILSDLDVYFDTAFCLHEIKENLFKDILFKHGVDKVLFATDCPWREIKEDVDILKSYNLGKEIEEKIFYKNALTILGL